MVESACISTPHFAGAFDYDENFSERCIHCPLPRTVVGSSHLGHEVPDCRVNVHFEEDLSSDCSQPPLWVLRSQKGHVERKRFHIEAHRHVVSLQHEPVSIDCLLEWSSHQSSAEWSSIFSQVCYNTRLMTVLLGPKQVQRKSHYSYGEKQCRSFADI